MDYMVVGHTKFGPNEVAQKTAGVFNKSDVWNQGHLQRLFASYGELLEEKQKKTVSPWQTGTYKPLSYLRGYTGWGACFFLFVIRFWSSPIS